MYVYLKNAKPIRHSQNKNPPTTAMIRTVGKHKPLTLASRYFKIMKHKKKREEVGGQKSQALQHIPMF